MNRKLYPNHEKITFFFITYIIHVLDVIMLKTQYDQTMHVCECFSILTSLSFGCDLYF